MNYGYSQPFQGGFGRYGMQQPYQAPSMPGPQGTSMLGRYAQGLDRRVGEVAFMREQGFTDDEIRQAGLDPNTESSMMSSFGGLLNQRDAMKEKFQKDMISGIESGAKYLGKAL